LYSGLVIERSRSIWSSIPFPPASLVIGHY